MDIFYLKKNIYIFVTVSENGYFCSFKNGCSGVFQTFPGACQIGTDRGFGSVFGCGCCEFQLTKRPAIMHHTPWSRKHDDGNKFGELAGKKWLRALQPKIGPPLGSIFIAHCDVSLVLAKISCFWYWQNRRDHMCGTALSFSFLLIVARALGVRRPRHPLFWPRSSRKCLVSSRGCWFLPTNIACLVGQPPKNASKPRIKYQKKLWNHYIPAS